MQDLTFLGNEALRERLEAAISRGRLSHCYLLCGPEGSGKHTLALWLAAAMQCAGTQAPCGRCAACRKVLSGNHPDVITCIDSKHKQFGVDAAREICADAYLRPNEGARKVYILPQEMNLAAQNSLLKLIEEPPAYAAFLILSCNPDALLPTVRSRCQELRLQPLTSACVLNALRERFPGRPEADCRAAAARSGGYLGQALEAMERSGLSERTAKFADCYARRDRLGLLELLVGMERLSRDDFIAELALWQDLLLEALRCTAGLSGTEQAAAIARSRRGPELMAALECLQTASERAEGNVGVGHLCGALRAEL